MVLVGRSWGGHSGWGRAQSSDPCFALLPSAILLFYRAEESLLQFLLPASWLNYREAVIEPGVGSQGRLYWRRRESEPL